MIRYCAITDAKFGLYKAVRNSGLIEVVHFTMPFICVLQVDTVKRICLKKLPPILAIQLKRFDYDWERETSVKFNDYFEFPRELDMDPYTGE